MDSTLGRRSGGVMRLRRERRGEDWRECSTSEEEREREREREVYTAGIASLLAGYARGENAYLPGDEGVERVPMSGSTSPTLPAHYRHASPSRQASPYPIESTNLTSGNSTPVNPNLSPRFTSRGGQFKKPNVNPSKSNTGTLSSRRRQHITSSSSMTSSASSDNCCQSDVTYPEVEGRERRQELADEVGEESPPEPAPPEVPPRGPSLHHPSLQHRPRLAPDNASATYVFPSQEYLMPGSPRSFPGKSPDYSTAADVNSSQHHHRLGSALSSTQTAGGGMLVSAPSAPPVVMPVFPLRPSNPGPQYSPYSPSRFHIDKRCQHRCSWKCCSIALILLSVALTAMLAYFGAVNSMRSNLDPSSCILVEDAKVVAADDQMAHDATASSQTPTEESLPTSTAVHYNGPSPSQAVSSDQSQQPPLLWPSAVVEIREFRIPHSATIPPAQFWNVEFRNKQPAFIRFNMSLPWGANFAVYGRRNVAPSITQYDFSEFVKGGRVDHRLKRAAQVELLAGSEYLNAVSFTTLAGNQRLDHQKIKFTQQKSSEGNNTHFSSSMSSKNNPKILEQSRHNRKAKVSTSGNKYTELKKLKEYSLMSEHIILKRSTGAGTLMLVNVTLLQYLDTGRWFLSVYNDDLRSHEIILTVEEAEGISTACPNDCSGHGSCYLGKCDCIDGFEGIDCSKSVCPVLCSNHGKYGGGLCHCEEGWKGAECDIPQHDCQVADCSSHGRCVEGACLCEPGWKGHACSIEDCVDPTCSGHGSCVLGKCYCKAGWQGGNCSQLDQQVYQCLPGCSEHGSYDLETGTCICEEFWTGADCSQAVCSLDCGPNGRCDQGQCVCKPGWSGERCDLLPCDSRCAEHGQCKNGTCVCSQGWNGRHCTLSGCVNACNRHGSCVLEDGEYQCQCNDEWAGVDCSVRLEMECNDELDNDQDGMIDCSDSECCTHPACNEHIMCLASNDPVEVLLRKQPPSVTASFYQRVKFLVEENSVQSYVHQDEYTERRVSVMRGQVLSPQGLGIVGIRVSVDRDSRFGFTLTRAGGWFDVLVNGGGAVTLQFQRSPFQPLTRTLFVPWNQIVVLPPITMQLSDDTDVYRQNGATPAALALGAPGLATALHTVEPCLDHDDTLLVPVILSTWMPEKVGGLPGQSLILAETQMLQESIRIPGSRLHLMYRSSLASGYLSRVIMRLTRSVIPTSLVRVHVRVEIEGSVHTKIYEADPNLTHTFAWNKRNVYKQKVYGVAQAKISIGYEHDTCINIVWETQTAKLQGFDVDISDVGGWSLDIHHHYNFHEGILQKGDGSTLHLKQFPRTVRVVMGTGLQRPLNCKDCDGLARDARLLTPVALTSGPDGSLYVGDFNLVRRLTPQGNVYTVLQLSATQVSYQYYLSLSPADGHLYISDPERHQILRVLSLDSVSDPSINWEPAVGSGERCIPGDETSCGDDGPAIAAKLAHPKGLAIAADKTMYIADGTNIRSVDPEGIIHTLIGHHRHHNVWQPIPCKGAIPAQQAQLQWPTGLSLSPLDGSLHFIDDRLVLKLTADLKVKVIAGIPLHCHAHKDEQSKTTVSPENSPSDQSIDDSSSSSLGSVLALAFSPNGQLFIADSDSRKVNAIRVVDSAGRMSDFAGRGQSIDKRDCDCLTNSSSVPCQCWTESSVNSRETLMSTTARFTSISAIAVSPDGVVNVADQGNLHILALEHYLATHDENGEFRIPYTATGEEYVFNRYGQHIATRDITTGKPRYTFIYSKNTSFGKLSTVTDNAGNKILFLRDYSNVVSAIENTQDHKCELNISGVGFLTKFSEKGRSEVVLDYDSNSGLLTSRADFMAGGGSTYLYQYDSLGRISHVVLPTGETINLSSHLTPDDELEVQISNHVQASITADSNIHIVNIKMEGQSDKKMTIRDGLSGISEAVSFRNGTFRLHRRCGSLTLVSAEAKHPLLELSLPVEAEMFPLWSRQVTTRGDITNTMAWSYTLVGDAGTSQQTLHRQLWVNNSRVLGIVYEQNVGKETVSNKDKEPLLRVSYDPAGLPLSWQPGSRSLPVNISYDRFNRVEGYTWGTQSETYSYDRHGLLAEIKSKEDGSTWYTYNDWNMLSHISLPSKRKFGLVYDEQGGLRHVTLPSGTRHSFSAQPSLGFVRYTYTPPGSTRSYLQHYTHSGKLLQTVYPGDGGRILYRYHTTGHLAEIVYGDGVTQIKQLSTTGLPSQVLHSEKDFEYRWDYQYSGGLLTEERLDYGPKTGLSNAKLTYQYDDNFRVISVQGRIGGQSLPEHALQYSSKTGAKQQLGQFTVSWPQTNETSLSDGTAVFSRITNKYFQVSEVSVTIHRMEVFKMEFGYDSRNRISQTRTYTRNVGVNTYTNVKNLTWDADGQLAAVEAQEPWGFKYDANGNMLSLTYRGNTIPMEYNVMDRIVKFGEGLYRYDNRGLVVQNAREEKFHYNTKGLLIRATKRGRFDVRYFYDHLNRLATRKDNYGNVTQFFYTNYHRPNEVSQIYSPRDGKLMSLVYDDRGHLVFAQVYRHKYYVATDQCGTPVMIFNQYGEGIREIMRSPYGHIVYDSNPYLYLPVDFCGGLLDQVTSLVHMSGGKVYDPLIGQWMSPLWSDILNRVTNPRQLHLYRFNGNDPINAGQGTMNLADEGTWLKRLGYDLSSLAPQLNRPSDSSGPNNKFRVASGFLSQLSQRMMTQGLTSLNVPGSIMRLDPLNPYPSPSRELEHDPIREMTLDHHQNWAIRPGSSSDPPFGRGILVSRSSGNRAVIHSVPTANSIYRDVLTSVFNNTFLLPFTLITHGVLQDAFFFVKEEAWRAQEDRAQLKRFGSQFNTTFHEKEGEVGSGKVLDVRIHRPNAIINLRYGTTLARERQRLLHHCRTSALRKAWHRERDSLRNNVPASRDWTQQEADEILKLGAANGYDGEYIRDVEKYPELAEDPYNIRFIKKTQNQR